jgi:hypothetical protein
MSISALQAIWPIYAPADDYHWIDQEDLVLSKLSLYPEKYQYVSERLKHKLDISTFAVIRRPANLDLVPEDLKKDSRFWITAISDNPSLIEFVPLKVLELRRFVLELIAALPESFWDPKGIFVFTILNKAPHHIKNLPPHVQNDWDLVAMVIQRNSDLFKYASLEIRSNPKFVEAAMGIDVSCLQHAHSSLRQSSEFVLVSMLRFTHVLRYADDLLKNDEITVAQAIWLEPDSFQFASYACRTRPSLVRLAVLNNPSLFQYVPHDSMHYAELAYLAISHKPNAASYIHFDYYIRADFWISCVQKTPSLIKQTPFSLRDEVLATCPQASHHLLIPGLIDESNEQ